MQYCSDDPQEPTLLLLGPGRKPFIFNDVQKAIESLPWSAGG